MLLGYASLFKSLTDGETTRFIYLEIRDETSPALAIVVLLISASQHSYLLYAEQPSK